VGAADATTQQLRGSDINKLSAVGRPDLKNLARANDAPIGLDDSGFYRGSSARDEVDRSSRAGPRQGWTRQSSYQTRC